MSNQQRNAMTIEYGHKDNLDQYDVEDAEFAIRLLDSDPTILEHMSAAERFEVGALILACMNAA